MAAKKARASSTDGSAQPRAWKADHDTLESARDAGMRLSSLAELERVFGDRRFVHDFLAAAPPLSIVMCEVLAEAGGLLAHESLVERARARTGASEEDAERAHHHLVAHTPLVVPLRDERFDEALDALIAPAAPHVAALAAGVSLPGEPPADAVISRPGRDLLALAALTGHRTLKLTRHVDPNRTSLKRFVKGLGLDGEVVAGAIVRAQRLRLVGDQDGQYRPIGRALRAAARGELSASTSGHAELSRWLPDDGWVPFDAVVRAMERVTVDAAPALRQPYALMYRHRPPEISPTVGFDVAEHGGARWVRRSLCDGRGDGHVTPSFEVILGPLADPRVVADVALGCELTRGDRVLTLRITEASVRAGVAAGLDADALVAALAAVGPHGLPDNVERMVRDWASAVKVGRIARGRVLFLPDGTDLGDLERWVLARPVPGAVELDPTVGRDAIARALAARGLARTDVRPIGEHDYEPFEVLEEAAPRALSVPPCPLDLRPAPDEQLRELVMAARAKAFAVAPCTLDDDDEIDEIDAPAVAEATFAELRAIATRSGDPLAQQCAEHLQTLFTAARPHLERFAGRLPKHARADVEQALAVPLVLAPYLVLAPKWQRKAESKSRSLSQLIERSVRSSGILSRVSTVGVVVLTTLEPLMEAVALERDGDEELDAELERALAGPPEPDERDDAPGEVPFAPSAHAMPSMSPSAMRASCLRAYAEKRLVALKLGAGDDAEVRVARIDGVQRRGESLALMTVDATTDEARVVHLAELASVALLHEVTLVPAGAPAGRRSKRR